jgi:molybdopterin converting factor small subunit
MAVTVKIPPQLAAATGGDRAPSAEGATVGEVLDRLYARHGELRERVADADGTLRRFVNVFLDGEDIRFLDGLDTRVPEGAELQILPAVAGG